MKWLCSLILHNLTRRRKTLEKNTKKDNVIVSNWKKKDVSYTGELQTWPVSDTWTYMYNVN